MILKIKEQLLDQLQAILKQLNIEEPIILEKPKDRSMGDYAIPCFNYAKSMKCNPNQIAIKIDELISDNLIEKSEVIGGYVNLFLNKKIVTEQLIKKILEEKEAYGNLTIGDNKTIVFDYSHPNIAKPFGIGHLRSTVIGNSIRKIMDKVGFKTIGINYLGDYGTQFGKIIYAYKTWGNEELIKKNPIEELRKLYVRFHEEVEDNPQIEDEGRKYFKKLEDKDPETLALWQWIRDESLKEFMKTYELLGITDFDSYEGEASIADKIDPVVKELATKNLLVEDEGAMIVRLGDDIAPAIITRNDGASLYMTRDLATLLYRKNKYHFDEALYVVGNEQTLHFKQLKLLIEMMGYPWAKDIHHISFGMILQDGKRMSTRKGKSINLHEILEEAIELANKYIKEKNPDLKDQEDISRKIGVGAVIFNDLKNYRTGDVEFNLEDILKFEGETGPYIQYTYARINSMLENIKNIDININNIDIDEYIWNIVMKLAIFEEILIQARNNYDPSEVAKYLIDLAQDYNKFYANDRILGDDEVDTEFKLKLSKATSIIIKEGMRLLGIEMPFRM